MTQLTGCRPSNKEIVDKFDDFITMFPTEDLTVLYDKETNNTDLPNGDLGTWVISSHLYKKNENKTAGIIMWFNRNTREAKGNFILKEVKNIENIKNEYPIYYNKDGIHFVDETIEDSIKEELANFNIMYNFISLNREYLDSLESINFTYTGEVPLYGARYKLAFDDININKIKELYPEIPINENEAVLDLLCDGKAWSTTNNLSLKIYLDDSHDNYFTSSMNLSRSDLFSN